MFYDPRENPRPAPLKHNPITHLVAPRPIGWISTVDRAGQCNLAPFSYFNLVCSDPPVVVFAPNAKDRAGTPKDTLRNVREVPEFVANVASWALRAEMNLSSKVLAHGVDEFALTGLEAAPSRLVRAPRVARAPAALECRVHDIIALPGRGGGRQSHLVIGLVIGIHIDDAMIRDGVVDSVALKQIARLGATDFTVVRETFAMARPD